MWRSGTGAESRGSWGGGVNCYMRGGGGSVWGRDFGMTENSPKISTLKIKLI